MTTPASGRGLRLLFVNRMLRQREPLSHNKQKNGLTSMGHPAAG